MAAMLAATWLCGCAPSYQLHLLFPDAEARLRTATLELLAFQAGGASCPELIVGSAALEPERAQARLVLERPFDQDAVLSDVGSGPATFAAEGRTGAGLKILRGCEATDLQPGLDTELTVVLEWACLLPARAEVLGNLADDDCDGRVDECEGDSYCEGNGQFTPAGVYDLPPLSAAKALVVADFDGDGVDDVAVGNRDADSLSVFRGVRQQGDPSSALVLDAVYPLEHDAEDVAVGDFNADGALDIITANDDSESVNLLLGRPVAQGGSGTFEAALSFPAGDGAEQIAVADFNADGVLDAAVANDDSASVSILLGDGQGGLAPPLGQAVMNDPRTVTAADFDADGNVDLLVSSWELDEMQVFLGRGDGRFEPGAVYDLGGNMTEALALDLDGDGVKDLAAAFTSGDELRTYLGQSSRGRGDGTFVPGPSYALDGDARGIAAADLDRDGLLDLALSAESNRLHAYRAEGDGSFHSWAVVDSGAGLESIAAGDFNGDGVVDLALVAGDSDSLLVHLAQGDCRACP